MNNWPLQPQATDFAIPRALVPIHDRFGRFYTNAHRLVNRILLPVELLTDRVSFSPLVDENLLGCGIYPKMSSV